MPTHMLTALPRWPAILLLGLGFLTGCAGIPQATTDTAASVPAPAPEAAPQVTAFTTDTLYDLLSAEMAGHRRDYHYSLALYFRQAKATGDLAIIQRATRLASFLEADPITQQAAALWLAQVPGDTEALRLSARALVRSGDLLGAFDALNMIGLLGGNPNFTGVAAAALEREEITAMRLLARFNAALAHSPDNTALLMGKSIVQQRFDSEAALATIRTAKRHGDDHGQASAVGIEATILQQSKRSAEALTLLQAAAATYPNHRGINLQYARLLAQDDLAASLAKFEQLNNTYPNDPQVIYALALIYVQQQDAGQARFYLQQLLDMGSNVSQANFLLGKIAQLEKNTELALEHYSRVAPGRDFYPALGQISLMRIQAGQLAELSEHIRHLRAIYPDEYLKLSLLEYEVLLEMGQTQQGGAVLDQALQRHPENEQLLYTRAMLSERLGDIDAAEADLRAMLALNPANTTALNALGYILTLHTQRYTEARALIADALALRPDDPAILDSMGWVQYKLGMHDEALVYLQRAHGMQPDAEIAAHLGEVLWQMQQKQQAMAVWQAALADHPDHPELVNTMKRLNVLVTNGQ